MTTRCFYDIDRDGGVVYVYSADGEEVIGRIPMDELDAAIRALLQAQTALLVEAHTR